MSGFIEVVVLNFKYVLMKVGFKIKGEGSGVIYILNKIVINVKNKGVYIYGVIFIINEIILGIWIIFSDVIVIVYIVEFIEVFFIIGVDNGGIVNEILVEVDYIVMFIF